MTRVAFADPDKTTSRDGLLLTDFTAAGTDALIPASIQSPAPRLAQIDLVRESLASRLRRKLLP